MEVARQKERIEPRYLGLAPLVFSFFSFIHLPPSGVLDFDDLSSPLYFFLFYLGSAFVTFLSFFVVSFFTQGKPFRIPAMVCILPTIVGIGLCFAYGVTEFGSPFQFAIGAALVGTGSALLLIMWGYACGALEKQTITPTIASIFALAYLVRLLTAPFITGPFNLVIVGAAIILSALPLDSLVRSSDKVDKNSREERSLTIRTILKKLWRPLIGCFLIGLIWGSTWGSSVVGSSIFDSKNHFMGLTEIITFLTPSIVCILALWKQLRFTQNFTLSIAVGFLILAWIFRFFGNEVVGYLADFLSGIAFALLPLVLWLRCCEATVGQPKSTQRFFLFSHILLTIVILLSFAGALLAGASVAELAAPICSILVFIMYAKGPSPSQAKTEALLLYERSADDSLDQPPSRAIMETQYGLTPRESEICSYFARGHSAKYISEHLYVSHNTVKTHVKRVYEKLGISSKDELITLLNNVPDDHSEQ